MSKRTSDRASVRAHHRHKAAFVASPGSTTPLRRRPRRSAVVGIGPERSRRRPLPRGTRAHFSASSLTRAGCRTRNPRTHARTSALDRRHTGKTAGKRERYRFDDILGGFSFSGFRVFHLRRRHPPYRRARNNIIILCVPPACMHPPRATRFPGPGTLQYLQQCYIII